jgi:hypothetical protein
MSDHNEKWRRRYAEDPEYREKKLAHDRQRYAEDGEFRERKLAGGRQRYAEDPQYREKINAEHRLHYQGKKAESERLFGPPLPKKPRMSDTEQYLWRTYGLTQADYDLMAAAQNGLCAICERNPSARLCVDHCHATHQLRFLLCRRCNAGLGQFHEDPRLLRRAADYAEFWQRLRAAGIAVRLVPEGKPRKRRKKSDRAAADAQPCAAGKTQPAEPDTPTMGGAPAPSRASMAREDRRQTPLSPRCAISRPPEIGSRDVHQPRRSEPMGPAIRSASAPDRSADPVPEPCPAVPNPRRAGRGTAAKPLSSSVPLSHLLGAQQVGQQIARLSRNDTGGSPTQSAAQVCATPKPG